MKGSTKKALKKLMPSVWVVTFIAKLKKKIKKSKHRRFVLEEWITTQQSYQTDVNAALEYISKPMLAKNIITPQQQHILFPQFKGMLDLSKEMIAAVIFVREKKFKNPNFIEIGNKLLKFVTFYKLYGTYFGCRLKTSALLKEVWQENQQKMKQIQQNLQQKVKLIDPKKQNITIKDCLDKPQYRLFKYELLMKEYLKKLPKYHRDYEPLKKACHQFEAIGKSCNDLKEKIEGQEKKIKLDKLFGKTIDSSSQYLVEMSADTIYFPTKLYIFNNLVIVSILEDILRGRREQQRYTNLELTEYSYIHKQEDMKYFKNILIICGLNQCLHFFLPDAGTRQQIFNKMNKVILELKVKSLTKRYQKYVPQTSNKLTFAVNEDSSAELMFQSEFQIEVISVDIRPLSTLNNDTCYITRFMIPNYLEDYLLIEDIKAEKTQKVSDFLKENDTFMRENTLNQFVQIHLSQLIQLHQEIKEEYPQIKFPQVDVISKSINIYTEGKKGTKMFEVRSFLMEEFFNFIFRHPIILKNPLWLVKKYRLNTAMWDYICEKNNFLSNASKSKQDYVYKYGLNHCNLCKSKSLKDLIQIEKVRNSYVLLEERSNKKDYCFNFYNLMRLKLLSINFIEFKTLQQLLLYSLYKQGRLDYALLKEEELNKHYQSILIHLYTGNASFQVFCDHRTKAGEILLQIAIQLGIPNILDYRLYLYYQNKQRIIDQDQFIIDIINKYKLDFTEHQDSNRQSRSSFQDFKSNKEQGGFFGFFKSFNFFSTKTQNKIFLKKIIYLSKELELKAIQKNIKRGVLISQEISYKIAKNEIILEFKELGEYAAYYYLTKEFKSLKNYKLEKSLEFVSQIIPEQWSNYYTNNKIFVSSFNDKIDSYRSSLKQAFSQKNLIELYKKSLDVVYNSIRSYSYIVPVVVAHIPDILITDGIQAVDSDCFLGVNYKELIIMRYKTSDKVAIRLPLQDITLTHTIYSLFIHYRHMVANKKSDSISSTNSNSSHFNEELLNHMENLELRFDCKNLFGLVQLFNKYKLLQEKFPQN